jgi:hypothetical protein
MGRCGRARLHEAGETMSKDAKQSEMQFRADDHVDIPVEVTPDHEHLTLTLSHDGIGGASVTMDIERAWRLKLRIEGQVLALRHTQRSIE